MTEAIDAVAHDPSARFVAGGTTLVDLMKCGVEEPGRLVDITDLPGLGAIETDDSRLRVRAMDGENRGHAVLGTSDACIATNLVQSTVPAGWITGIDTSRAMQMPGVLAVLTHDNVPRLTPKGNFPSGFGRRALRPYRTSGSGSPASRSAWSWPKSRSRPAMLPAAFRSPTRPRLSPSTTPTRKRGVPPPETPNAVRVRPPAAVVSREGC
jgi:hypothetical protein